MGQRITIVTKKGYDYLKQRSTEVDFEKDDYKGYISKLKEYCETNVVYALSPVQIGIPKRLIYIRNTSSDMSKNYDGSHNESIIYINPVIKKAYGHTQFLEGCESCIDADGNYIVGVVDRPYKIDIEYTDIEGKRQSKTIKDFEVTVFCHEYDHLDGILHMDRIDESSKMTLTEMREYRAAHKYNVISEDCEYKPKKLVK